MDSAKLALEYLVAGNASDALLAQATRELLGRPGRRSLRSASSGFGAVNREAPGPDRDAPAPSEVVKADNPVPPVSASGPIGAVENGVRSRGAGIPGLRPELLRVNVRIGGKRTSLSFPRHAWTVLERRFGGRGALLAATEESAAQFRGRGSRSAWVLDQLEMRTMREAAQASLLASPPPAPEPSVAGELRSVLRDLFSDSPAAP